MNNQPTGVRVDYDLAQTEVGRGYHAVGTAAGTYVSTLTIVFHKND